METPEKEAVMSGDELLRAYLATHDAACGWCGYKLRGLAGRVCPECGAKVKLGVHSRERIAPAWFGGAVAWSMLLAMAVLAGCVFLAILIQVGPVNLFAYGDQYWFMGYIAVLIGPISTIGLALWFALYYRRGSRSWVACVSVNALLLAVCFLFYVLLFVHLATM